MGMDNRGTEMTDFRIERTHDPVGLRLIGEIDMSNEAELNSAMADVRSSGQRMVLDMSELTFIDSSGLHVIVRHAMSMNGEGPLILLKPSEMVVKTLTIVGGFNTPDLEVAS